MQSIRDNLQDLKKCTVAIRNSIGDNILGTGVIVTDDGLIVTCYHVIGDIKNKTINNEAVRVNLPLDTQLKAHANIIEEYCNPELDIAFLQLQEKLPVQTTLATLSKEVIPLDNYQSLGFRESDKVEGGLYSAGTIQGKTHEKFNNPLQEIIQLTIDHNRSKVPSGMSGAPVLDTNTNKVIGIISSSLRTETHDFAIPIESIIKAYPELKDRNPGLNPRLSNIAEFLNEIGLQGELYQLIDEVYVAPVEYGEIKEALEKDKLVFIVGTKEYGKTYTAIKLLLEYYRKGYKTKYIQTKEEEKRVIRNELAGLIQKELMPKTITYFEDPFGKINYQSDEELENEIGTIIDAIRNSSTDAYTIITSREEVFKEFEYKSIAEKLIKYEKSLNIKTPSYDYEKRKEISL